MQDFDTTENTSAAVNYACSQNASDLRQIATFNDLTLVCEFEDDEPFTATIYETDRGTGTEGRKYIGSPILYLQKQNTDGEEFMVAAKAAFKAISASR